MTELPPDEAISILIVNYNGKVFLGECLDSIKKNITCGHEIILVDNASQDGSVDFIKQNYPSVTLVASAINTGFTGGNNLAAKYASGRYLLLLNNDTIIRSPIEPLLALMDEKKEIGILGCRLLYGDGRQQESIGHVPNAISLALYWLPLRKVFRQSKLLRSTVSADSPLYGKPYERVSSVSGAFLLTPAALWQELGGLDERYFMYMEDIDYCRRVAERGRVVAYSALCEVTHFEGAGKSWIGERAVLNSTHSYLVYTKKYYGVSGQILFRLLLSPIFVGRAFSYALIGIVKTDGDGLAKARAYGRAAMRLIWGQGK